MDATGQNIRNAVTGDDKPVDYNRDAMLAAQLNSTIRDTVAQDIEDAIVSDGEKPSMFDGKFLSALYRWGMGELDSAVEEEMGRIHPAVMAIASGLLMDTDGTQAMLDAKQGGATDEQALAAGIFGVFNEALFGETDLDTLQKVVSFLKDIIT